MATATAIATYDDDDDDDDRESTTPSKRKQFPHNPWVSRAVDATATKIRRRQWSFMLYLTVIVLSGLTLMNIKESETLSSQSANAIRRIEDILVLPTILKTSTSTSSISTTPHPEQSVESLQQQQQQFVPQRRTNSTLALLYPPGLLGGYRNQVIRFISVCVHAAEQNLTQLLLPSLLWSTQVMQMPMPIQEIIQGQEAPPGRSPGSGWNTSTTTTDSNSNSNSSTKAVLGPWQPIPMEWIFDVDYWNEYAAGSMNMNANTNDVDDSLQQQEGRLPALVRLRDLHGSDCWEKFPDFVPDDNRSITVEQLSPLRRAVWQQGTLGPISNLTQQLVAGLLPKFNPRKKDLLPDVQHCQNPVVYGGGRSFGRLWNDAIGHRKKKHIPYQQDVHVLRALRPAPVWREVGQQCVQRHVGIHANGEDTTSTYDASTETITTKRSYKYVALHARIELEMMAHKCGKDMEWNLTKIVEQVQELAATVATTRSDDDIVHSQNVQGLFVAVSRSGMQESGNLYRTFQAYADDNLRTLNRLVRDGAATPKNSLHVFECGESMLEEYYQEHLDVPDHGSLLQSVINFDIAVNADIFVGVRKSSYSTDVWTTRYHQGKGDTNYEYTKSGTRKIEDGGLPTPHINCK
jgi:hypothetical protein